METFPNQYGACECTNSECLDVFQLCGATNSFTLQEDILSQAFPASPSAPRIVVEMPFIVYSFNGRNGVANNWLAIPDTVKSTFLQTTNQFTVSLWLRVEDGGSSYLVSFELGRNRYFSIYDGSSARMIVYYFRDALPGFTSTSDDGYETQVALSFYYNQTQLPSGIRDNQWHFISLTVDFPSITLVIDGVQYQPTRGNYRNQFQSTVNFNRISGVNYTMPAPILVKSATLINSIVARIGGSIRTNNFALFGEMRQLVLSNVVDNAMYACLASCNNLIGVDPSRSFPNIVTFYNPVTRTFDFTGPANAAVYTMVLQSLIYYTNGFLPPQEDGESRRITLRINDERGLGTETRINLIGRSNQNDPLLDVNGDLVAGINFMVEIREDVPGDQEVQILSPRSFITDPDIDSRIVSVTVNLTNPQSATLSQETIRLVDNPPSLVNVTDSNGVRLVAGSSSRVIFIDSVDPLRATSNVFITALLNLRYSNTAEEPMDVDRIIEFTVFDGLRRNNPRAQTIVRILITDDVPVIDLNGPLGGLNQVVTYLESSPPTLLAGQLVVTDPDSTQFVQATARIDRVFDERNETIAFDLGLLGGLTCAPLSCNGTDIVITGLAVQPAYQRLLRTLQYVNLKQVIDLPNLRDRTVFVTVNDGVNSSNPDTNILIDFVPINPRVIIELAAPLQNYSTTFTEAQANPILCHSRVRAVDTSIDSLESIVVSIRDVGITENEERINLTSTAGLDISIEINTALKRITFSQVANIMQYLEAIRRIQYFNGESEPVLVNRFVDFLIIPGGGAPSDTAVCNITILGMNDNVPECPAIQPVNVSENSTSGYEITQLIAIDLDQGVDGELTYQLVRGIASPFQVTVDGLVRLFGDFPLDREVTPEYFLTVEACDGGSPQFCCQFNLTVIVTDVNDNPPIFNSTIYAFNISENVVRDFPTVFGISDEDEGINSQLSSVEIDATSFPVRAGCFDRFIIRLDSDNTIILSTAPPSGLDFEVASECSFAIIVYDAGIPTLSGRAMVTVSVINQDDFPPEFSQDLYTFIVEEENTFPLAINRVVAVDRDSPVVTFSLRGAVGLFEINTTSGVVSILFSSDHRVQTVHSFTAVATDPAGNTDTAMVTVSVVPINNEPPVLDLNVTDQASQDALTPVVFVEEGVPVRIITDPLVTDPDEVELTITQIRVRVANSGNPGSEVLSLSSDSSTPPHTVLVSTTPAELIIQPQNVTSLSDVHDLLQSILYDNTEDELSECRSDLYPCRHGPLSRTLLFAVFDGRFFSNESLAFVMFELVNDPPLVDLDESTAGQDFVTRFREGTEGVSIVNTVGYSISDEDSQNLTSLTCNLTNPLDLSLDTLSVRSALPAGLILSTANNSHILEIVGNAPVADFETALGSVVYLSTSNNPNAA